MLGRQRIDIYAFDESRLRSQLKLPPPDTDRRRTNQLAYLASYVGSEQLGCRSVLIERHYIDRDYIEDHSLFYSRSLFPYQNYCQRVHFFNCRPATTRRRLSDVTRAAAHGPDAFKEVCDAFSNDCYLGFSVIKPLTGSPIGRTILRSYPEGTDDGGRRLFTCTRTYAVHVNGVELHVNGLPFQEQDVGVSACATTAVWCALQKIQESENLPPATPAQITMFASRFSLPFGRVLPADEGLSVEQMCQAVQGMGVSPSLFCATDYATTRSYLYSTLKSGMAPMLIMEHAERANTYHAVTGVGMRLRRRPALQGQNGIDDVARDLDAIYVHDDRTGPYLRANLVDAPPSTDVNVNLLLRRDPEVIDAWKLTHILVPTHAKIRLSFSSLRKLGLDLVGWVHKAGELSLTPYDVASSPVSFETWVARSPSYLQQLYFDSAFAPGAVVKTLTETIPFPRYLGVVRLQSRRLGLFDVLFDTTSTVRNLHAVAVVVSHPSDRRIRAGSLLSQVYDAPLVF